MRTESATNECSIQAVRTTTLGVRVDVIPPQAELEQLLDRSEPPALFTFVNPAAIAVATRVPDYAKSLATFDVVLPDGIGMCLAMRLLHRVRATRVSFDTTSFAPAVMRWAVKCQHRVALVGGRPGIAEHAAQRLSAAYPGLMIVAVCDGFGDFATKISELRERAPEIVICGMGAGAQERFLIRLSEAGWQGFGFTCGGYLDQLAEALHYYPAWIDAANLRWAYRLVREPRRLARRYLVDYGMFAVRLAGALVAGQPAQNGYALPGATLPPELAEH